MKDKKSWLRLAVCMIAPILFEVWFRFLMLETKASMFPVVLYAALVGGAIYLLTGLFSEKVGKIVFCVCNSVIAIYFIVQVLYYHVFQVLFSLASTFTVGLDVLQFSAEIYSAICDNIWKLILYVITTVVCCVAFCRFCHWEKTVWKRQLVYLGVFVCCAVVFRFLLLFGGTGETTAHHLYTKEWSKMMGAEKLGMLVVAEKDIVSLLSLNNGDELDDIVIIKRPPMEIEASVISLTPTPTIKTTASSTVSPALTKRPTISPTLTISSTPTLTPTPTPTPIDTSPNVLNIDFQALADAESNKDIKKIHKYFIDEEYTLKNEYTGMFEGYNLIFITAEGFAPYAMVDGLTPTLKKLSTEGFVFNNYYSPIWHTSTIDGEFANTTGLIPTGSSNLKRITKNIMPFAFGNAFSRLGYITNAYHNHSDTYYSRDKIYPVMGYDYKGRKGIGMPKRSNGKYPWPGSDEIMMQLTTDEYITKEPFHTYYMTVSGHLEYSYTGNQMAADNKSVVKDLPYSKQAKAYIACNYELEKALTYLIEQLEEAGVAERTVIVLATDHYPYGLEKETIDELVGHEVDEVFELYKSTLIIWSPSMKEPVEVDKYCSSIDIAPTVANLFGLEYDSRLYMGKDILSTSEGLVVFNNKSFITDRLMYNARTKEVTLLTEEKLPEDYLSTMKQIVKNRFKISESMISLGYYKYLPDIEDMIKQE